MLCPDEILFAAGQSEIDVNKLFHQELFSTQTVNIATTGNAVDFYGTADNSYSDASNAFDTNDSTFYKTASAWNTSNMSGMQNDAFGQEWSESITNKIYGISLKFSLVVLAVPSSTLTWQPQTYDGSTWTDYGGTWVINATISLNTEYTFSFATPITGIKGLRLKCVNTNGTYQVYSVKFLEIQSEEITVGWPTTTYDWMLEIKRLDADEDWRTINTTLGLNKSQAYNLTDTATTLTDALTRSGNTITIPASLLKIGAEYIVKVYRVARGHFDIQLYSGTGANRTVSHNLRVPPCAFRLKAYDKGWPPWCDYHKTVPATYHLRVNQTNGAQTGDTVFNNTAPTSTQITLGSAAFVNQSGANFCLYLWGASGIYDVKRYTTTSTPHTIDLDWPVQSAQFKNVSVSSDWVCLDTARDTSNPADECVSYNNDSAEATGVSMINFTSSGIEILSTATNPIFSTGNDIDVFIIRRPEE